MAGMKQGLGTLTWGNGDRFEATYGHGQLQGSATLTYASGKVTRCLYQEGWKCACQ